MGQKPWSNLRSYAYSMPGLARRQNNKCTKRRIDRDLLDPVQQTGSFVVHLFQGDWKIHATIKEMCRSLDPATVEKRNFNEYMRLFTQAKIWIGR